MWFTCNVGDDVEYVEDFEGVKEVESAITAYIRTVDCLAPNFYCRFKTRNYFITCLHYILLVRTRDRSTTSNWTETWYFWNGPNRLVCILKKNGPHRMVKITETSPSYETNKRTEPTICIQNNDQTKWTRTSPWTCPHETVFMPSQIAYETLLRETNVVRRSLLEIPRKNIVIISDEY